MILAATILFWLAVWLVFWSYAGYPIFIALLGFVVRRKIHKGDIEPPVTILITAYNEEKDIEAKIANCLELEYPREKLQIVVASDGSSDRTDELVRALGEKHAGGVEILLHRVEGRKGKTAAQNSAVKVCTGDVIVFSDAASMYDAPTLRAFVRNYADPRVGAVSGRYDYFVKEGSSVGKGADLFWRFENFIKTQQSRIWTLTGASGCIYSLRRSLYTDLPAEIISDLCEPLTVVGRGYRVVFEPEAHALEETAGKAKDEFKMRIRVIVRGMNGMLFVRSLYNPFRHPWVAFQLWSHKVSRWLVWLYCVMALAANIPLAMTGNRFYQLTMALQLAFYVMALVAYFIEKAGKRLKILSIPLYFCVVNVASAISLWKVMRSEKIVTWQTQR